MRTRRHAVMPVVLAAALLAGPAAARAQTGATETGGAVAGQPAAGMASASDGAVSVSTRTAGLVGRKKTFRGTIGAAGGARTAAKDDGTFAARWKPDRPGSQRVRARVEASDASVAAAAPEIGITLYKAAIATWYGPGFYGNRTACGQRMSKTLRGVAHKTLKCGTKIEFYYGGRTVTVPVVDRGPFANGAKWDLTAATAQDLGFEGTDTVGALTA